MKIKDLKLYKKICILTSGVVVSSAVTYSLCGEILFGDKEYEVHKILSKTSTEDSIIEDEYYESHWNLDDAIVLKMPYQQNDDGSISRNIYYRNAENYSYNEINYIEQNFNNQDILLEQDYIKSYINNAKQNNYLYYNHKRIEQVDQIPSQNNYEIYYVTFDEDFSDVKKIEFSPNAKTILYGVVAVSFGATLTIYIGSINTVSNLLEDSRKKDKKIKQVKNLNLQKD